MSGRDRECPRQVNPAPFAARQARGRSRRQVLDSHRSQRLAALGSARPARGTPHHASASVTLVRTLRRARSGDWRAIATRPLRSIRPLPAAELPPSASSSVLLPAPLGPSSATSSPARSSQAHVAHDFPIAPSDAQVAGSATEPCLAQVRRSRRRPEAHADPAARALKQTHSAHQHEDQADEHDPERDRVCIAGGVGLEQHRAGERLVVAVDVACRRSRSRRPRTAWLRAPR